MHKVYAELVFLDNFAVNLLVILLAAQLTGVRRRWGRYMLAAGMGGIYASVAFGMPLIAMLPIRAAVGVVMGLTRSVRAAYGARGAVSAHSGRRRLYWPVRYMPSWQLMGTQRQRAV